MDRIKAAFIVVFTAISSLLGVLAVPVYIQTALHSVDYITGLWAAPYRGQKRNSKTGLKGLLKKFALLLLVFVGAVMDWLILYAGSVVGIDLKVNFVVASLISVWVICNELLSIFENVSDLGVVLPPFLQPIVQMVQKAINSKVDLGGNK